MSDCPADSPEDIEKLICDLWQGHPLPHLDRLRGIHWFRTDEIPGDLQPPPKMDETGARA